MSKADYDRVAGLLLTWELEAGQRLGTVDPEHPTSPPFVTAPPVTTAAPNYAYEEDDDNFADDTPVHEAPTPQENAQRIAEGLRQKLDAISRVRQQLTLDNAALFYKLLTLQRLDVDWVGNAYRLEATTAKNREKHSASVESRKANRAEAMEELRHKWQSTSPKGDMAKRKFAMSNTDKPLTWKTPGDETNFKYREYPRVSQGMVAAALGVDQSTVARWLNEKPKKK